MKDVNKIILIGRLGTDPVQRETKSGYPVTQFPVATSRRMREEGEQEGETVAGEETTWHRVITWGKQAETCAQHLKKGQTVFVEGMVRSKKYTAKDGSQRMAFEVHADNVSFLSPPRASLAESERKESGASAEEAVAS
jgi:single-strand DNA-binding protein